MRMWTMKKYEVSGVEYVMTEADDSIYEYRNYVSTYDLVFQILKKTCM